MTHKFFLSALLIGASLIALPFEAQALENQQNLQREIQSIEAELSTTRGAERRMELVRELHNNREQLSTVQRQQAEEQRRALRAPAADPIIERQAKLLEQSQEFLPEEIAHLRKRNLMERVSQDAVEAKKQYDEDFSEKVVTINTQVANLRAQIRNLEEQKLTLVREYHDAVADLRAEKDLPLQPITTPTQVRETTQQPRAVENRNNRGFVGSLTPEQPSLGGGGGVRHYSGTDFQAH